MATVRKVYNISVGKDVTNERMTPHDECPIDSIQTQFSVLLVSS